MTTIYIAEHHHQLLELWREQNASSLRILHLDFHCDMRGLMINRRLQRSYRIWDYLPEVDEGNFLTHAIHEGHVRSVRWVHDEPGGRQLDVGTVKYETDLTALPYRLLNAVKGNNGIHIAYKEIQYREWTGLEDGEVLDIDWDFFASLKYPADTIGKRVDLFFKRKFDFIPEEIYVCYSSQYCHPSREEFGSFIERLEKRFNSKTMQLRTLSETGMERSFCKKMIPLPLVRLLRSLYHRAVRQLRNRGIY